MTRDEFKAWVTVSPDGCWIPRNRPMGAGYVQKMINGRLDYAHRRAYRLFVGPIPSGLELDHLCRNRRCCNPEHLEAVTHAENLRRSPLTAVSLNSGKTHCKHGHEFTPENTRIRHGCRYCRVCARMYDARRRARRRANTMPEAAPAA